MGKACFAPPPHSGFAFIGHANLNHQLPMIADQIPSTTSFKACCISSRSCSLTPTASQPHTGVVFAPVSVLLELQVSSFSLFRLRPPSGQFLPFQFRSVAEQVPLRRLLSGSGDNTRVTRPWETGQNRPHSPHMGWQRLLYQLGSLPEPAPGRPLHWRLPW